MSLKELRVADTTKYERQLLRTYGTPISKGLCVAVV
jgi:hypothetical protein